MVAETLKTLQKVCIDSVTKDNAERRRIGRRHTWHN